MDTNNCWDANPLVGTWQLRSHYLVDASGRKSYPFERDPVGRVIYTKDGFVSLHIAGAQRQRFASGDRAAASIGELVSATKTYQSFCGRYELMEEQRLTYYIDVSLFPNWSGCHQERYYSLEGDRLRISTPPLAFAGKLQTAYLSWERLLVPVGSGA